MNTVSAGIQMGNTTVVTYIVDCYPEHALTVITFYAVLLNLSIFTERVGSLIIASFFVTTSRPFLLPLNLSLN